MGFQSRRFVEAHSITRAVNPEGEFLHVLIREVDDSFAADVTLGLLHRLSVALVLRQRLSCAGPSHTPSESLDPAQVSGLKQPCNPSGSG